ncbi:hypothetical protein [Amorphus sp. 3PC139-8]|uniref:hypothetical protein n=1 Tax=Amorphus sp. 3PC139-8 TaxID=2735676 RepID=UPI00345D1890
MRYLAMSLIALLMCGLPASAGELLASLERSAPMLSVSGTEVEDIGGGEIFRNVKIEIEGKKVDVRAEELRLTKAGGDIQAVLSGVRIENSRGQARAKSITVTGSLLESVMSETSVGPMSGYAWVDEMEVSTGDEASDRLFVKQVSIEAGDPSRDSVMISTVVMETHSGERLELARLEARGLGSPVLSKARAALGLGEQAMARTGRLLVYGQRLVVFSADRKALLGVKEMNLLSVPGGRDGGVGTAGLGSLPRKAAAVVGATRILAAGGQYQASLEGMFVPVEELAPAAAGHRLAEAGLPMVSGTLKADAMISATGDVVASVRVETDQLIGLTVEVRGSVDVVDEVRVNEIADGASVTIADYPVFMLSRLGVGYQDRGLNRVVEKMTGKSVPDTVRDLGNSYAALLPGGDALMQHIIGPLAGWIGAAAEAGGASYASTNMAEPVSVVELGGLAALSPKTFLEKLGIEARAPGSNQ